jgi:hypothetical protein
MPDEGMEQVFWQSESMLHLGAQPELIPELELVLWVALLPPLLAPPEPGVPPAPGPVVACPPTPAARLVSLPDAQATKMAALAEKRATKVSFAYFTLVGASLRDPYFFHNDVVGRFSR